MTTPPFPAELLDACISCGYCLPACPTYQLTKDEASSPRGRINLMKAINLRRIEIDNPVAKEQASFCLGCRACEPVCPAGVQYGSLLEQWRSHAWQGGGPTVFALTTAVRWPVLLRTAGAITRPAKHRAESEYQYLLGCFERLLYAKLSRAMADVFPKLDISPNQGCCGALHAHNGHPETGARLAHELGDRLDGTIVTTAGGCAAHLAEILGRDRVRELSEWIIDDGALDLDTLHPIEVNGRPARISIQDSCHLRNGLGVSAQIRTIVQRLGDLVELPSAAVCCGAAGTYSILRKQDANAVFRSRLDEIAQLQPDYVAVVNPGCYRQVATQLRRSRHAPRVVHLVELIAAALHT